MRRTGIAAIACLLVTMSTACGSSAGSSGGGKTLTFVSTGGAFQDHQNEAWLKPYTAKTGTKFRNDGPTNGAKLKTMVESGNITWDILDQFPSFAMQYCGTYLEKLDFTIIDRSLYPPNVVSDCAVPAYFSTTLLMYDTSKFGANPPTVLADFFDTARFPGKRVVSPSVTGGMLEMALLADGVAPDKLYPLDVDRALRMYAKIKKDMVVPENFGQVQQAMETYQVTMALSSNSRAYHTIKNGKTWAPVWDKNMIDWDALMVVKGSPNKDEAMRFIAFESQDAQQKAFSELEPVWPINDRIKPNLNESMQKINAFAPGVKTTLIYKDAAWWAANADATTQKWLAWLAG